MSIFKKALKSADSVHAELVRIRSDNNFKVVNHVYWDRLKLAQKQLNELQQSLTLLEIGSDYLYKRPSFIIRLYRFLFNR